MTNTLAAILAGLIAAAVALDLWLGGDVLLTLVRRGDGLVRDLAFWR